ncbi:MAG: bZIP transcription factor [Planctomycetota bacterium]
MDPATGHVLAVHGGGIQRDDDGGGDIIAGGLYKTVTPGAPAQPIAIAEGGTVDPFVTILHPEASALLPSEQPLDSFYITMQTSWDAAAFFEQLSTPPVDESIAMLPNAWWRNDMEIIDVIIEREMRLDDGTWGDRTVLDPLPGREGVREMISDPAISPAMLPEVLEAEADLRENIRRPPMYPMISGPGWMTPVAYAETHGLVDALAAADDDDGDLDEECARARRRIVNLQREIDQLRRRVEGIQNEEDNPSRGNDDDSGAMLPPDDISPSVWPEIPGTWLAQGSSNTGTSDFDDEGARDARLSERRRRQIEQLERRIERLQERLDELCEELQDNCGLSCDEVLGRGDEPAVDDAGLFTDPALNEPLLPLADTDGAVSLLAHDLSIEPGREYRYRATVVLVNPFFGKARSLVDEQRALADSITLRSEPSEWSAGVRSMPETYIRVVQASEASRPLPGSVARRRPASARVDVYRFFYGYWRAAQVDLNTGDQVLAEIELPELPLFTVEEGSPGQPQLVADDDPRTVDDELEVESELVMAGVFESASRGSSDVLFSMLDGRTLLASQLDDRLWELIQRSQEAAVDAVILEPGSNRAFTGGGQRPGPRNTTPRTPSSNSPPSAPTRVPVTPASGGN